jgi:hypothetical protein
MGNSTSSTPQYSVQMGGAKLYKLMKNQTSTDTINFKKGDLVNTLSDNSINEIIHKDGLRINAPNRDRYSKLESQQLKNKNSNFIGGNASVTSPVLSFSVTENDLSAIKNLIIMDGGCGCGENKTLSPNKQNGGFNNSATLNNNNTYSVTSTFMPQTMDMSVTSVTSVTSATLKNTSDSAMNRLQKIANIQFGGDDESENDGVVDLKPKHNTTSELINALSLSSQSQPIDYANVVGGAWNKQKGGEDEENDIDESSSSTSPTESPDSTLKRVHSKVNKERSKKASSTSSDDSSSSLTTSISDSSLDSSSSSSISKSSPYAVSVPLSSVRSISGGNIYIATDSMSGGNFIDAKQFYSSENGELYSSNSNYLKNNISKRRFH